MSLTPCMNRQLHFKHVSARERDQMALQSSTISQTRSLAGILLILDRPVCGLSFLFEDLPDIDILDSFVRQRQQEGLTMSLSLLLAKTKG